MNIFAKLMMPLEDRLRGVLRRRDQLRQLDAEDRVLLAMRLRGAAAHLDTLEHAGAYEIGTHMGERVSLAPQLRDAAERLEGVS